MISFISYSWEPFAIGPLVPIFLIIWLFFTIVSLLMKFTTDVITCLHALTMYHERNKSYIMQLFKNEKLLSEHYYFAQSAKKFSFLSGSGKIWKSFPLIGKVFAELGQNFAIFSKNQKLSQLLGVSLITIYKSLPSVCIWENKCPLTFVECSQI